MPNRTTTVTIRCTPEERAEWHALAAAKDIHLSEYIRHMLCNRMALSHSEAVDLSYLDDEELVIAHQMMTSEAARRLRLRRLASAATAALLLLAVVVVSARAFDPPADLLEHIADMAIDLWMRF